MLKKTIRYINPFTGELVTEDHYFHISKSDLVEMEMEELKEEYRKPDGTQLTGMQAKLQRIVDSEDGKAIMAELKEMIRRSYGKKEGDRFLKSQAIWEEFASTAAFSELIFELCTNATAASEFIAGIVPSNLDQIAAEVREQAEQQAKAIDPTGITTPTPEPLTAARVHNPGTEASAERQQELRRATPDNPVELTRVDILEMDDEVLRSGLAEGRYKFS